jgi:hypothetical protein
MRNMTGAATARVLSEMYREKSGEIDSRTSRDRDAGAEAGRNDVERPTGGHLPLPNSAAMP